MLQLLAVVGCLGLAAAAPWKSELHDAPKVRRAFWGLDDTVGNGADPPAYNQTVAWYTEQTLDHFTADESTFSQRYFLIDNYFTKDGSGPVILHVCGEYTCPGIMPARLFPLEIAQKHNALVVSVEARFFGLTQPFGGNNTSPALEYLNSRQHIADLAQFVSFLQAEINKNYSRPSDATNKFAVVGGSYPGALTSWFREKYPFLSVGAHSASGVVLAVGDYSAFDHQVAWSAGEECASTLREVTAAVMADISSAKKELGARDLHDGDFLYMCADGPAEAVQYGHRDVLCDGYMQNKSAGASPLERYFAFMHNFFFDAMGNAPSDYDSRVFADPVNGGNGRSWWWQKCTELAYWQVAPKADDPPAAIRSSWVNRTMHEALCDRVFGSHYVPDKIGTAVAKTNVYYGGNTTGPASMSNVVWTQGGQDPWQHAGVQSQPQGGVGRNHTQITITCDGCAHCADLYTPTPDDPQPLKDARDTIRAAYDNWFAQ